MSHTIRTSREHPQKNIEKNYMYSSFKNEEAFTEKVNGLLPTMGWNSWNAFGTGNNEALTKAMCEKIVELGLDKLGYKYIVLDDGCYNNDRTDDKLQNFPERFPNSFRSLADYIHSKGLKFGMYNDIGPKLCSGLAVGTCGYEDIDAKSYVDWDIDFLKVDNCYYLWDNATFSDSKNAKYTYAPKIKGICIKNENYELKLDYSVGKIIGKGASVSSEGYITNIGTFDGTNIGPTPVGAQSSEIEYSFSVNKEGIYELYVTYASGEEAGVGQWLQVGVNKYDTYAYDRLLPKTEDINTFSETKVCDIYLVSGENKLYLMNHRRQENTLQSYAAMFYALKEYSDKNIVLSICEWGKTCPQNWGYKIGNSWRILNDITFQVGHDGDPGKASWQSNDTTSITSQYNKAVIMDEFAGLNKGWNDPDMLVVGMNGITETMMQTHMVMWCMMNSPLMLGMDLRRVQKGDSIWQIIANEDLIKLNQDSLGIQAKRVYSSICENDPDKTYITNNDRVDVLVKPLENDEFAISFINLSDREIDKVSINKEVIAKYFDFIILNDEKVLSKNLITKEEAEISTTEFSCYKLAAYDSLTLRISKKC